MRGRPWVWSLLAVSLALNLFFGAWVAVSGVRSWMRDEPPATLFSSLKGLRHLDTSDPAVAALMERYEDTLRTHGQELRDARVALRDLLEQENLSGPELVRALARVEAGTMAAQRTLHEFLIQAAQQMTPEQRRELAASVLRKRHGKSKPNQNAAPATPASEPPGSARP